MKLSIVVPCYNEQEVLPEVVPRMVAFLNRAVGAGKVDPQSEVIFVDDGSEDKTWQLIRASHESEPRIRGVKLSANRGHQTALMAGLFAADGDAVVSIDADLQDEIGAMEAMVDEFRRGFDVVYGVRDKRDSDDAFKRLTAIWYYRMLSALGVKVVFNHADYRLLSRRALEALKSYSEVNLFLRGIVPLIGFRTTTVYYNRAERYAGKSKYPVRRMLALAVDGITSFTALPLRMIAIFGVMVSLASVGLTIWALWIRLFTDQALPGWASSVIPIYFLGGIQLLSIGVLGEYVAKTYVETKRRPRYFIEEQL